MNAEFDRDGFVLVARAVSDAVLAELDREFSDSWTSTRQGGRRDVLRLDAVGRVAVSALRPIATELIGADARAVRATLFDKTPRANWKVIWHQDQVVPLVERVDDPRYVAWTRKVGVWHARPPVEVLERMVALRLHLDDCGLENGPLRVIPGTHRGGVLSAVELASARSGHAVNCVCARGDVLAMRPLLLHASSAATRPARRRVLHVEFAVGQLPGAARWRECV